MQIIGFTLDLAESLEDILSKLTIADDFLDHRTDMMSFTLVSFVELFYDSVRQSTFIAQSIVERLHQVVYLWIYSRFSLIFNYL